MKSDNFAVELPQGYEQVYYLNARSTKTGVIFSIVSVLIVAAIVVPAVVFGIDFNTSPPEIESLVSLGVLFVSSIVYMVLHELTHGAAYKLLTGRKLTFGLSWSCAYCGVPDIFVNRKTALIALLSPFVLFSVIFTALTVWTFWVSKVWYFVCVCLLGIHVGGCCGDLFVTILLLFKYRDKSLLMRDTGPEQFFYLKKV
ncbi:MAG: DUF3267 domain-containing protein [Candidatus Coproplasma sp.]